MAFTIASQGDIDAITWPSDPPDILIRNAAGALKFTTLTLAWNIKVQDSPQLEALDFLVLKNVFIFELSETRLLSNLSMPALHNGNGEVSITLTDTPSLFNIDLGNQTEFDVLSIFVHTKPPEESYEANFDTAQIVNAYIIETDYCIQLYDLTHIGLLSMFPLESCGMRFFNLSEAAEIALDGFNFVVFDPQLTVSRSLTLRNLKPYTDKESTAQFWTSNEMTVGDNVDVSSSSYSDLDFSLLTTVGGNISFVNNTNCTFNFDKLTEATNLYFLDNINTTLPMFPVLTRARDIHLRGIIDTYVFNTYINIISHFYLVLT